MKGAISEPVDPKARYTERRARFARELAGHEARFGAVGTARLACVVLGIGLVVAIAFAHLSSFAWAIVGALTAAFVALVVLHARIDRARARSAAALAYCDRGLSRLTGDFSGSRTGEALAPADHPYAFDLDVFGRSSLFQRVSVAETRFGEGVIARWLSAGPEGGASELLERQEAARELAELHDLRESLAVLGATLGKEHDPAPMLSWVEKREPAAVGGVWRVLAIVVPLVVIAAFALGPRFGVSSGLSALPYLAALALSLLLRGRTAPVVAAISSRETALSAYGEIFALIESASFTSARLRGLQSLLRSGDRQATGEMRRLGLVTSFADGLSNEVFRIFIAPVFAYEPRVVFALEAWRARNRDVVRGWLEALGEVEALASFGTMAFESQTLGWPTFTEEPCFVAVGLGHPLLVDGKRKDNDVSLPGAGCALVVTGSNMSGKSTLMRAMGVNAALALAGAPVRAKSLKIGMLRVATSMRVSDSLAESTSHFYAELKKLKLVTELAKQGPGVFFLLDEILHGTNSRERLIGARAIVRALLDKGALGAVSTHDLGLSDLEGELPSRVSNVHFQEQVEGDAMTFDYVLRPGVVQSSNALRLMKLVGLDVGD